MTDWATISALATGGGTLVLAIVTFGSVRSSNRSARLAEESLLASVRPLLMPSRLDDPPIKVGFGDQHWVKVAGGRRTVEVTDEAVYLTMSLRNAGAGIAVLHSWRIDSISNSERLNVRPPVEEFRRLTRDIYIPASEMYFWQGAIRETDDPDRQLVERESMARQRLLVDILYGDQHGGQRAISRFIMTPTDNGAYLASLARHWNVDRPDPR